MWITQAEQDELERLSEHLKTLLREDDRIVFWLLSEARKGHDFHNTLDLARTLYRLLPTHPNHCSAISESVEISQMLLNRPASDYLTSEHIDAFMLIHSVWLHLAPASIPDYSERDAICAYAFQNLAHLRVITDTIITERRITDVKVIKEMMDEMTRATILREGVL